ncbi:MAG: molybdate ABC transporter substrate-binding protein [Rhodospirillaceae bacterium]|nr:molybdate ABC transporter substrate-binding protein [Rhodospirillaceae bacterium]
MVLRVLVIAALAWLPQAARAAAKNDQLLVFAASSLTDVLNELAEAYAKTGHAKPALSFAASAALARQIENGAPASLFMSADEQWMDYVAERKLVADGTRTSFLGNTLVLVTPADKAQKVDIKPRFPLAKVLAGGKLSMGDPDSVPVGKYGKAALESLGVWRDVEPNVIRADNVRVALAFVERGEAAAGIVYATDAALTKKVAVAGTFPANSYPPVSYPLGVIAAHDTPAARAFRDFILSADARAVFVKYGFVMK